MSEAKFGQEIDETTRKRIRREKAEANRREAMDERAWERAEARRSALLDARTGDR